MKKVNGAKVPLKSSAVLVDGLPAVTLTYGNNFTLMRWKYSYLLRNGVEVSFERITPTPSFLVGQIRENPNGHIYEKMMTAATESFMNWAGSPNSLLFKGELKKFNDSSVFKDQLKDAVDGSGVTLGDKLKSFVEDFFNELDKWIKSQPPGAQGVETPFIPPANGTPMLNFFPSPYEWFLRKNETVGQVLTSQRQAPATTQIRTGGIIIVNPPSPIP